MHLALAFRSEQRGDTRVFGAQVRTDMQKAEVDVKLEEEKEKLAVAAAKPRAQSDVRDHLPHIDICPQAWHPKGCFLSGRIFDSQWIRRLRTRLTLKTTHSDCERRI